MPRNSKFLVGHENILQCGQGSGERKGLHNKYVFERRCQTLVACALSNDATAKRENISPWETVKKGMERSVSTYTLWLAREALWQLKHVGTRGIMLRNLVP